MFSSPELFNEIFGITDHGLNFLWLWRNISLSDLNFFFILEAQKRSNKHIQNTRHSDTIRSETKNTFWINSFNLNIHSKNCNTSLLLNYPMTHYHPKLFSCLFYLFKFQDRVTLDLVKHSVHWHVKK